MGRLADSWSGRKITQRIPYSMFGELVLAGSLSGRPFPSGTFDFNIDMPFEVHRLIPRVVGIIDAGTVASTQPDPLLLMTLVKAKIDRIGGTITWTKVPTRLDTLVKGTSEMTWELADPDTVVRQEGYAVELTTEAIPVFTVPIASLRVEFTFQGFLLQLAPASERR